MARPFVANDLGERHQVLTTIAASERWPVTDFEDSPG